MRCSSPRWSIFRSGPAKARSLMTEAEFQPLAARRHQRKFGIAGRTGARLPSSDASSLSIAKGGRVPDQPGQTEAAHAWFKSVSGVECPDKGAPDRQSVLQSRPALHDPGDEPSQSRRRVRRAGGAAFLPIRSASTPRMGHEKSRRRRAIKPLFPQQKKAARATLQRFFHGPC